MSDSLTFLQIRLRSHHAFRYSPVPMAGNGWGRLARALLKPLLREAKRSLKDSSAPQTKPRRSQGKRSPMPDAARPGTRGHGAYAGDFTGTVRPEYSPNLDGNADPGEIVWAWVPYEEDHSQGKDRPTLVVGRDGKYLLALMLTSKDHTSQGRSNYLDLGTGDWDRQKRPSEVRLDRVLRLDESAVRREGSVLDPTRFKKVAKALSASH